MYSIRALFYLLRLHTGLLGRIRPRARRMVFKKHQVELDVYEPRRTRGVILLLHGLVPAGHKDPYICDLATGLAAAGFRVLVPYLQPLASLSIKATDASLIEEIVITVTLDRNLCPAGKVALMSGSYPGLLALQAAGNPEIAGRIATVFLTGAIRDAGQVAERALEGPDIARWILYRNFLHLYSESSRKLEAAFSTALTDRLLERTLPELPFQLDQARPAERKLFYRIENEAGFRRELGRNMLLKSKKVAGSFSLDSFLPEITAPLVLLHDAKDPLSDAEQSRKLYRDLTAAGGSAYLLVTAETNLADLRLTFKQPREIFALVGHLGRFFRYVAAFSGPRAK